LGTAQPGKRKARKACRSMDPLVVVALLDQHKVIAEHLQVEEALSPRMVVATLSERQPLASASEAAGLEASLLAGQAEGWRLEVSAVA